MTGTSGKIERSTLLALVAMALGVFVIANDFTALSVAIPEIEQIAGGAVGLGFNTAIVASASSLTDGISAAFTVDAALGVLGFLLVLAVIGRHEEATPPAALRTHHRAHA
jgi:hypothetical protein